jgi:hypothetical protein
LLGVQEQSYPDFVNQVYADLRLKDSARLLDVGDCWVAFTRTKELGVAERDPLRVDTCVSRHRHCHRRGIVASGFGQF